MLAPVTVRSTGAALRTGRVLLRLSHRSATTHPGFPDDTVLMLTGVGVVLHLQFAPAPAGPAQSAENMAGTPLAGTVMHPDGFGLREALVFLGHEFSRCLPLNMAAVLTCFCC